MAHKTVTRLLSEEQLADYQPFFDNHRRLKALVHEIEELSLAMVETDPRWPRPSPGLCTTRGPGALNLRDGVFPARKRAVQGQM